MAIRSLTTIISDAISFLTSKRPNIATFTGTVTRDVIVESPAQEMSTIYEELSRTQQLHSVNFASDMTSEELDNLAANYNLTRLSGTTATGTITLQIRNFTISSSTVSVSVGTVISTVASDTVPLVTFVTSSSTVFLPSLAPSYFNPDTGLYEQTVSIVAQSIGFSSNVAAGTITRLVSSVPGIDSVVNNVATTGGTDVESNEDFANRIRIKLSGNNVGTPTGILSLVRANSNVLDAIVVTANDAEMQRDQFGGEVDIYILGNVTATTTDLQIYQTAGTQSFTLQRQPAKSVVSITGIVSGSPYTFVPGTDFAFTEDTSQLFGGSTGATSSITFLGATLPDNNTQISITYTYNFLMESLQTSLDEDAVHIVSADILVREASAATVDIEADIDIFSGNAAADIVLEVQTALSTFINTLGLGKSINRSDIIAVIEGVDGVDSVDVDTLVLVKNGTPLPQPQQKLTIFKTEYAVTGSLTITSV